MPKTSSTPRIALVLGDPAGIGAELAARLLHDEPSRAAAQILVVGDRRVLAQGAACAGLPVALPVVGRDDVTADTLDRAGGVALLDLANLDPAEIEYGAASDVGGAFALDNFRTALGLARHGLVDAVCYTPFNKQAMRMSYPPYEDELTLMEEEIGAKSGAAEFNAQEQLWSARVTSHVPISQVASLITREALLKRLRLTDRCMRAAGYERPHIAVAGLNPHAGDGGNFGREEIDVIAPAIEEASGQGINCSGPYSPDTVFVRGRAGEFDAVLTMYHDQGQIAMKLINFHEGVVFFGGFDFPVTTPAHGTAYDIAGKGVANPGASRTALLLAARMAANLPRKNEGGRASLS